MADQPPLYCFVCGTSVSELEQNGEKNLTKIHIHQELKNTQIVHPRKAQKRKIRTKDPVEKDLQDITESSKSLTNEGICLERILKRKIQFSHHYNYICKSCVRKVHNYHELSEELEKIQNELVDMHEMRKKDTIPAKTIELSEQKIRKSSRKTFKGSTRRIRNPKESQTKNLTTAEKVSNAENISSKDCEDDNEDRVKNNTSPVSSRRSVRIKENIETTNLKENKEVTARSTSKEKIELTIESKDDGEIATNKSSILAPTSRSENIISDKCNEMKQPQLKQTSILDKSTSHPCEICGKSFPQRHLMVEHLKAHTHEKPFSCDKCHKSFKARHSLREHVLRYHDKVQKWICNYSDPNDTSVEDNTCNQRFSSRHLLMRHRKLHDSLLRFSCDVCNHEFATRRGLQLHSSIHTGKYSFSCTECSRGFSTKTLLQEHSLIHTGEKPISCDKCDKKFANRGTYWSHRKIHELGSRPFVCDICSKSYNHSSHLAAHKRKHTGERPYVCWVCSKEFSLASHLKRHMGTHDGNPDPFCCLICSELSIGEQGNSQHTYMTFNKRVDLVRHYRECHPGETIKNKLSTPAKVEIHSNSSEVNKKQNSMVKLPSLFDSSMSYAIPSENIVNRTNLVSDSSRRPIHLVTPSILSTSHEKTMTDSNIFLSQYTCGFCHAGFQDTNSLESHVMVKHPGEPIYSSHGPFPENANVSTVQVSSLIPQVHITKQDEISIYQQLNSGSKQNETLLIVIPDTFSQQS